MPPARRLRAGLLFLLASALGTGCDLGTKLWATEALADGARPIAAPWFSFQLTYNRGTAFSVVPSLSDALPLMALLALAVAVAIGVYVWRQDPGRLTTLALAAMAAGALGNGYDRAFRDAPGGGTGVVDFISVTLPGGYLWPTFNVADVLLVLGVAAMIFVSLGRRNAAPQTSTA